MSKRYIFKFIGSPDVAFPADRSPPRSSTSSLEYSVPPSPFPPQESDATSSARSSGSFYPLSIDQIFPPAASSVASSSSFTESASLSFFDPAASGSTFDPSQHSEQWSEVSELRNVNSGQIPATPNLRVYTFAELKTATKNFRSAMLLSQGFHGKVYKGWVDEKTLAPSKRGSGMVVAIKKLNPQVLQGFAEWQSTLTFLGRISHPNIIKLLGYCWNDTELLLVYEFMPNRSLENHLFRPVEPLSWELRLKILIGAARGLAFLHNSDREVIHRDFKASNILLDANYNAKISGFGLAKLGPLGGINVTTRVIGTYGYAAPEYLATGNLYVKSDVYAFGVILLEMMTGLGAYDPGRTRGQRSLVEWLSPSLYDKNKLEGIMDRRIKGQYSSKAAMEMAQITLKCIEPYPKKRSSMTEVVNMLENFGRLEIPERFIPSSSSSHPTPLDHQNDYRARNE